MSYALKRTMGGAATAVAAALAVVVSEAAADDAAVPLLARYCHSCHAGDVLEGDVDLSSAGQVPAMRAAIRHWQRAAEVVADGQMPPQDAEQPSDAEREEIAAWLAGFLRAEAEAHAGDPGRVVLRRLNNAEYTYTIRELTGVDTLSPAREFPAEGGAGEGFTNTGQSLVMSPSMVVKYLDAGKDIARHLVLLPEGIRFSAGQSRRDFTDELLEKVRALYRRSTQPLSEAAVGSQTTVEQGITLDMGREGFLPLRASLEAARDLAGDAADRERIESIAAERGLSPRYLRLLLESLQSEPAGSLLLDRLRSLWAQQPGVPLELLVNEIEGWQQVLWRFNKVGQIGRHLGREDGPASWMEAVSPLVARQEYRVPMPAADADGMVTLHLAATAAGDGSTDDLVVFERPRLVAAGREDLPLLAVGDLAEQPADAAGGDLRLSAPETRLFALPAELVAGCELVTTASIAADAGGEASVQVSVGPGSFDPQTPLTPELPILAREGTAGWQRMQQSFDEFRDLFPQALCYVRIVPVDEVVTLNVLYREDEHLRRLMLTEAEAAELERLWDELLFVSAEPLKLEASLEQITEFATQDRPDLAVPFRQMKPAVEARAEAYRERLVACQPAQLDALVAFAEQAFRRPLQASEAADLRGLHGLLLGEGLSHEEAMAMLVARVLVSPDFLYKLEVPPPGESPQPIGSYELATRLSYFLWSSPPDAELLAAAADGSLASTAVLVEQAERMLADSRASRLAIEFGTHWLHVSGFAQDAEKNEAVFPEFAGLRGAIEEETVRFLTDFFQHDRSILSLLDADHTFLNEQLAAHYGIPGVEGDAWRRVEGVRSYGRGGVLTLGSTLATQAGASRTSPILRGNWLFETMLGEKLPKPPKDVPLLAETVPAGLTERQLIELHSENASCSRCHRQIDPLGFALEEFDAVGRFREADAAGQPIDASTTLPDGTRDRGRRRAAGMAADRAAGGLCRAVLPQAARLCPRPVCAAFRRAVARRTGVRAGRTRSPDWARDHDDREQPAVSV